jgi:hypothetical protein
MGRRSTSLTNVASSESWGTIKLPPLFVVVDSHNDKSNALLGRASRLAPYL